MEKWIYNYKLFHRPIKNKYKNYNIFSKISFLGVGIEEKLWYSLPWWMGLFGRVKYVRIIR